jgi:beta-lactamase superfamily II metal-dependent hydrolase
MGYQVDFLPVGDSNGDAICIRYGTEANGYTIHVVDGGWSETSQVIIDHIEKYYGKGARIDHMVLSHADNDHAVGLPAVLEHFEVGALWMNRPWLYAAQVIDDFHKNYTVAGLVARMKELHEYLVELEKIAERKKVPIYPVFQGSQIGSFHVLAPSQQRYLKSIHDLDKTPDSYVTAAAKSTFGYITELARKAVEWVGEKWDVETLSENVSTNASNETCLVQMGYLDSARILLTADVGPYRIGRGG